MNSLSRLSARVACLFVALSFTSCTDDSGSATGSLTVLVDPEDVIISGLEPGDDGATIRDGWTVEFDKYLVTLGHVKVRFGSDPDIEETEPQLHVVDLARTPSNGIELWRFDDLRPGRWEFNYELGGAAHGAKRHAEVDEDDFEQMVDNDWTYLVQGSLTKADGESCPPPDHASVPTSAQSISEGDDGSPCYAAERVEFSIGVRAETGFTLCTLDGLSGVSVPTGGTQTASITIHGDHLFFNGFPEGSEGSVRRYAQWWANADLDLDGQVTVDELRDIPASALLDPDVYALGGAPIQPVDNLYTYVVGQLKTQGHYQGEGECLVDGVEHEHAHEDEHHEDEHGDEDHEDEHGDGGSHEAGDSEHADASAGADADHDHSDHDHDDTTDAGIAPGDAGE